MSKKKEPLEPGLIPDPDHGLPGEAEDWSDDDPEGDVTRVNEYEDE
jgi:hypothetical protein